ncbi:MAG: peptidylprolyl isomerase [Nitrospinota bacterium]|nr:peptidylprolyl isomerase [Nitrospinota bacterium]
MKKSLMVFLIIVQFFFVQSLAARSVVIERIVAKINEEIVTLSELQEYVRLAKLELKRKYKGKNLGRKIQDLEQKALDNLVEKRLLIQKAKKIRLSVSERELNVAISSVLNRAKITIEQLKKYLRSTGSSLVKFKSETREKLLIKKVENIFVNTIITVTKKEIREYYNDNLAKMKKGGSRKVKQIFFPLNEEMSKNDIQKTKNLAEMVLKEIKKNPNQFSDLARKYSKGPSAIHGGELGVVKKGEILPKLEKAIFSIDENDISGLIQTRAGFHIAFVYEVIPGKTTPFKDVSNEIRKMIIKEKSVLLRKKWISELKKSSFLEISYSSGLRKGNSTLDLLFKNIEEHVVFRIIQIKLLTSFPLFGREKILWKLGIKKGDSRWATDTFKLSKKNNFDSEILQGIPQNFSTFVNPDPALKLFWYRSRLLMTDEYLGSLSFADIIKKVSLNRKQKNFTFVTDEKKLEIVLNVDFLIAHSLKSGNQSVQ